MLAGVCVDWLPYRARPVTTRNPARGVDLVTLDQALKLVADRLLVVFGKPRTPSIELDPVGDVSDPLKSCLSNRAPSGRLRSELRRRPGQSVPDGKTPSGTAGRGVLDFAVSRRRLDPHHPRTNGGFVATGVDLVVEVAGDHGDVPVPPLLCRIETRKKGASEVGHCWFLTFDGLCDGNTDATRLQDGTMVGQLRRDDIRRIAPDSRRWCPGPTFAPPCAATGPAATGASADSPDS